MDGRESDIVAVVGVRDPGEVGWALCIDAYGHGLYLPWSALHAMLHDFPAYTPDTAYVGSSFAAFVAALSYR